MPSLSARKKYLITVVGPTAIGKTSLAISLAQHFRCEILSADSRQFFKEMSIGTAVPSAEELAAATHHFIGNKSVTDSYTVGDFERDAVHHLERLFETNDYAVLVGGSGLYIDAVINGIDVFPEINPEVRTSLQQQYEDFGITYLQKKLEELDPKYFQKVDQENPQRLMRALEVCIGSGLPYSSFLGANKNQRSFTPIVIGLEAERAVIYDRINSRVDAMMIAGLLDEVKGLLSYKNLNALQTVGYRELFAYINGYCTLDFAVSEIKKNTRRFAKRQLTWFKKNKGVAWFDFEVPIQDMITYIDAQCKELP